ncbi:MAG: 50S ribosomal protein L4 [Nanoarchaeota archaeon]
MKTNVFSLEGKKTKTIDLPQQFAEEHRPDLVRRAHLAIQSHMIQPYGAFLDAGKRQSAKLSRRRRKFKTAYGKGLARSPRKSLWRRGTQFGWVGAVSPNTTGGRRAHPPKAHKDMRQKINEKERKKALRSALAMSIDPKHVKERGHIFTELPSVVENKIEDLAKTKDVETVLHALGLTQELLRTSERKIRAGKGKLRGRKYRTKKGPLIVVSAAKGNLMRAGANIPGVDVATVSSLNMKLLAPGGVAGRLAIYSEKAIERLNNEQFFINKRRQQKQEAKTSVKSEKK